MAKLVSMKLSQADREKGGTIPTTKDDGPTYPYGLNVSLEEAAIAKLGIDLPKVGTAMTLIATVDVTSVSSNEHAGGQRRTVSLQITDLCLEAGAGKAETEVLYNGDKAERTA